MFRAISPSLNLPVAFAAALLSTIPVSQALAQPSTGEPASHAVEAFGLKELAARKGLPNVIAKLAAGEEVRVAYLGGSITNAPGWRVLSLDWLKEQYPKAKISEIHAAISGTGSAFGAFRLQNEVIDQRPDLLFVEFAVNDGGVAPERIIRGMEGIVRRTWKANPHTDICFVYTLGINDLKELQAGKFQRSAATMEKVAEHYGIPTIHFGVEVARLHQEGKLIFTAPLPKTEEERRAVGDKIVFAGDAVHPHVKTGHPLYLASIQRSWPGIVAAAKPASFAHTLPSPIDPQNWETARSVPIAQIQMDGEWQKLSADTPQAKAGAAKLNEIWSASKAGTSLTFRFKGRTFGLYGLKGPDAGEFRVTVDNRAPVIATQFDSYCTTNRWRINPWVYPEELPDEEHEVRIELLGTAPDKLKILKGKNGTIDDPAQLAGTNLHVSQLLLLGELLPAKK